MKLGKTLFISLQQLFSFSKKSKFRILIIQIPSRHQMPKHKTRNTFYLIAREVSTVCWNLASVFHIRKENFLSKKSTKTVTRKLVPSPFVFAKN